MRKLRPIPIGTRVQTTMGIIRTGIVIDKYMGPFTDGSYRDPYFYEDVVYCQWDDDNTKGWTHRQFVEII